MPKNSITVTPKPKGTITVTPKPLLPVSSPPIIQILKKASVPFKDAKYTA